MPAPNQFNSIKKLRGFRNAPERDLSIGGIVSDLTRQYKRRGKEVGGASEAWAVVVPPDLAGSARIEKLVRGVLTVKVVDSAARFALDRFLRSGGERTLSVRSGGVIRRVKLC